MGDLHKTTCYLNDILVNNNLYIYTDASFNCQKKIATYAFYVILNGKHANFADCFSCKINSANDAEIMALGHALNYILLHNFTQELNSITIFMDSISAINAIIKQEIAAHCQQKSGLGLFVNDLWQKLINKTMSSDNRIEHIKAHTLQKGEHFIYNNWCDKNARKKLREIVGSKS